MCLLGERNARRVAFICLDLLFPAYLFPGSYFPSLTSYLFWSRWEPCGHEISQPFPSLSCTILHVREQMTSDRKISRLWQSWAKWRVVPLQTAWQVFASWA